MPRSPRMTPEVKAAFEAVRQRRISSNAFTEKPLWTPDEFNIPQQNAFNSLADFTGFGGSAGSGKSETALGIACRQHKRSVIFRRESVQLGGLLERARELFTGHGDFVGQPYPVWRNLPGDRSIRFSHAQHPGDEFKEQGKPKDFIAFDELPHFRESQFWNIVGWLRTADPNQRTRVFAGFNPPMNADERWVIDLFGPWLDRKHPNPAMPGELRWRYRNTDGKLVEVEDGSPIEQTMRDGKVELIYPKSWTFFPARLSDNRYYANSGYGSQLQQLPEPLRSQLLYGDFDAAITDDPWQIIPTRWIIDAMERWKRGGGDNHDLRGFSPDVISQDVAQGGKDKTVNARKYGHWICSLDKHEGKDTPDGPSAAKTVTRWHSGNSRIYIDATGGHGGSSYDQLRYPAPHGYGLGDVVYPLNFSSGSDLRDRSGLLKMANLRAEMMYRTAMALDPDQPGGSSICLPDDPELLQDLAAARYEIRGETYKVESKDEIKKRIGRSPDCGDAVMMLFLPIPSRAANDSTVRMAPNKINWRNPGLKRAR
jgi:hypothetical protein